MTPKPCKTILISDAPSDIDEFGPHQRVADAISDLILYEADGGKTIGVEGGWGSGKSTVVNFIKSNLSHSPNNLVMVFDAWAHQGDPLRRTFLESLILQAEEKKWVDPEIWRKKRAIIAQRLKIERKDTHSLLKPWARFLLISTLLLPVGATLLNSGLGAGTVTDDPAKYWKLALGLTATLLPFSILICVLILRGIEKLTNKNIIDSNDPFVFLFQNTQTDTTTETFQTINPTSIEFEQDFNDLMGETLSNETRKVAIVLDNLDRIDASDALSLLSTLQTFLQYENKSKEWLKRLWILIPYDRCGLEKLWDANRNDIPSAVATTFLDKRFQIRFEIPPILLSDWSTYLMKILATAFPDHQPKTDFHALYRVYANCRPDVDRAPTPRELKLYVNQIGTIHRQWQDEFPITHYGYYVLLKRAGDDVIKGLLSGKYPDPKLNALLGDGVLDSLAALAFNEGVSKARQLLLRSPIETALGNGDDLRLLELSKNPGFSQVLESVRFSEWTDKETNQLANAGRALFKSKALETIDANSRYEILKVLRGSTLAAKNWSPFDIQMAEGIAALLELVELDIAIVHRVLEVISSSTIGEPESGKHDALYLWMSGIIHIFTILEKHMSTEEMTTLKVRVPSSMIEYIEACAYLYEKDTEGKYWKLLQPTAAPDQIASTLGELVQPDTFSKRHLGALDVISAQGVVDSWEPLFAGIKSKLNSATQYTPEFVTAGLATVWQLREKDSRADSLLKDLVSQGFTLHHLHIIRKDPEAVAYCLISFFYIYPDLGATPEQGNSENGRAFINQIFNSPDSFQEISERFVDLLEHYHEYELMYKIMSAPSSKEWVARIIRIASQRENYSKFFVYDLLSKNWEMILQALDEEKFNSLLSRLIGTTDVLAQAVKDSFEVSRANFYSSLVRSQGFKDSAYTAWCINGLKQVTQDVLQAHIDKQEGLIDLILALVENRKSFDLGTQYQEVLVKHGEKVIKGEVSVDEECVDCWDSLFSALSEQGRYAVRTRLLDAVKNRDGNISPLFFDLYGKELANTKKIDKSPGIVIHLFTPLVKNRNFKGIRWILEILEKQSSFFSRYTPDEVADLKDWVEQEAMKELSDDAREPLQRLHQILGKVKMHKKLDIQKSNGE